MGATKIQWMIIAMGIVGSLFYGFFAVQIFWFYKTEKRQEGLIEKLQGWLTNEGMNDTANKERFTIVFILHQLWLNFVGAVIGWLSILLVAHHLTTGCSLRTTLYAFAGLCCDDHRTFL
ncbi:hypothetical protein A3I40_00630 [Candidatus Uhrbacteria bacterium RIFCSPLOWO2_02_FULL_48_12]|uniref:Uncharacterized protein n=1 Tax=Candidatus Uhrbacteria bacterium RIFCSPLOWO2_02_FULL_48_12 TaxID=1802407 RepID=A0A1F7V5Y4_9BACT|nr:MAG: hypothetical protein A3I40_00630 [Candidatus Uhrbacteria bacterium RIFCSPLOWO2_02_FULL_48_12]